MNTIIELVLAPFFAVLSNGVFRKLFARFQNRKGPPIIQPFYDLIKLWNKESVEADESRNIVFYSGLIIALLLLIVAYFILFGALSFDYDFIILIYLLVSVEVAVICSAFASRNAFSFVASMRELVLMIGYELIIAFSIINIMSVSGELSVSLLQSIIFTAPLSLILILLAGFAVLRVTPYDTVNAGTEISSGMATEYSGRVLFLYLLIERLKEFFYYVLMARLIIGWNIFTPLIVFVLVFFYALMNASSARFNLMPGARRLIIAAIISLINVGVIGL